MMATSLTLFTCGHLSKFLLHRTSYNLHLAIRKSNFYTSSCTFKQNLLTLQNERVRKYLEHLKKMVKSNQKCEETPSRPSPARDVDAAQSALTAYIHRHIVDLYDIYLKTARDISELTVMREEYKDQLESACDNEITEMKEQLQELESQVLSLLAPDERGDNSNIIIEISAGVGGQEAMLFTADLFNMYKNFCSFKQWQFEPLTFDATDMGGMRKASASVSGKDVYKHLKYEGGVHRVQRVPRTEKSGRIHTSTSTVAVLPEPTEIDVDIKRDDLKWDTFKASGSGGQHVNKTESAVRVTHIPTGMVAECQVNRSQIKNREMALKILSSKLYEKELEKQQSKIKGQRKLQVGSAGRSEKIRTYNFPQDRVTEHRIGVSVFGIDSFLSGETLEDMIDQLITESMSERLEEILQNFEKSMK